MKPTVERAIRARAPARGGAGRQRRPNPDSAAARSVRVVVAILGSLTLAACRPDGIEEAPPYCEVAAPEPVVAPVYMLDGEPLNLGHDARRRVDRWVAFYRDLRPDVYRLFLGRSGRYEERILDALRAEGLPEEFLYLAMIESAFDPNAYSRAHAVGLWQFLAPTGALYGLEVGGVVDERRHPERSTAAALAYLSDLYEEFDDWLLAAAAYNGGPTRLARAIRQAGTRDFWKLVEGRHLPPETAEYVPKILAAAWLGRNPGPHGFGLVPRERPPAVDTVRLEGRNRLSVVAAAAGVSEERVRALNPWLVEGVTPADRRTEVLLPDGTRERFERIWPHIPAHHRRGEPAEPALARADPD